MIFAAVRDEALIADGKYWQVVNWPQYQTDPTGAERVARYREAAAAKAAQPPKRQVSKSEVVREDDDPADALDVFEEVMQLGKHISPHTKEQPSRYAWNGALFKGVAPATILSGLRRYEAQARAFGTFGTKHAMSLQTFLRNAGWAEEYPVPESDEGTWADKRKRAREGK